MTAATAINTTLVTPEQLKKCNRIVNGATGEVFYIVESQTAPEQEYKVSALLRNGQYHLTCTCPAGLHGTLCWHVRAALAHALEYKAELKALAQKQAQEDAANTTSCRHCGRLCKGGICPRCAGA